jgi:hypothetical protein
MAQVTLSKLPATIAAGQFLSNAVELATNFVVGIIMPDNWTPARVTILVSVEGLNYYELHNFSAGESTSASEFKFNVTPNAMIAVDPNTMLMAKYVKLRSGTTDEPVAQEEARTFTIVTINTIVMANIGLEEETL